MKRYSFMDYNEYFETQVTTNRKKANNRGTGFSWVKPKELDLVAVHIRENTRLPHTGICHGVRTGAEVRYLRQTLSPDVIGTDLVAHEFKDVVIHDMNVVNSDWVNSVDFVYSNSFDHAFDPYLTFNRWMDQLRDGGKCYIHWGPGYANINRPNCTGGTKRDLERFVDDLGYVVYDIIETGFEERFVLVSQH